MCMCMCICSVYCNMYMYIVAHLASQQVIEHGNARPYAHAAVHLLMYIIYTHTHTHTPTGREGENGGRKWWKMKNGGRKWWEIGR